MARKKKFKIQLPTGLLKYVLIGVVGLGAVGFIGYGVFHSFTNAAIFKVKTIVIDPSLEFIDKDDLLALKGKNIFLVDLKRAQRKISAKYPEVSHLKIVRHFPDQIHLGAKKRKPFFQAQTKTRLLMLDEDGVLLSANGKVEKDLPLVSGIDTNNKRLYLGRPVKNDALGVALKILKAFKAQESLSAYRIYRMNVLNLSKIHVSLDNDLDVIVDRDKINHKMRILAFVLSQGKIDLKEVRYIDLRFKEPIIGKK